MTIIGNDDTPGIQSEVDTQDTVGVAVSAPANGCLVGPANTDEGTADENEVQTIRRGSGARDAFGDDSILTEQVINALGEGAMPVFAIAVPSMEITDAVDMDSGVLDAPVSEDPEDVEFTVDGNVLTSVVTLEDPAEETVPEGEVYYNPITGDYVLGQTVETDGEVVYEAYDYEVAIDTVDEERGETVDYIGPVQETPDVTQYALAKCNEMESYGNLAMALCGLPADTEIKEDMDIPYDSSRLQVKFPARGANDNSSIGSFVGKKASLGLSRSAIGVSLDTQGRMRTRISQQDQIDLVKNNVVPVSSSTGGARIVDDPTTVTNENAEEQGMRQGYGRIVMDAVIQLVHDNEEPYIGRLNTQAHRNSLQQILSTRLSNLEDSQAITNYNVNVEARDAMSVDVEVDVVTTQPLRNIYNTITAGTTVTSE